VASCPGSQTLSGEGVAVSSTAQTVLDLAENASLMSNVVSAKIDKTAPTLSLNGGPAPNETYPFGAVPPAPSCSAADLLSGLDGSCTVQGYSTVVGSHTLRAVARDRAGNETQTSTTYTVLPMTFSGFHAPIDMGDVSNVVKAGATIPLKFEVFLGTTELTDVAVVRQPLLALQTACSPGPTDEVEMLSNGGTQLRYDASSGEFIFNWQTPRKPGFCYVVTVTLRDGTWRSVNVRLK
jgi:hypothetical protein